MYIRIIIHVGKISSSSSFGLSHSLPLGKQTIARLKTNNTQVFVYIIYENTRSPRLLRADLARTLQIQTRAPWKDCLDLLLTDALRGNPRRFGSFFWDAFSVLSLTAFPFFHTGILPKRQGGNLLFWQRQTPSAFVRFFGESIEWCLQERRGPPVKRECLMKESVKVRSERSLSLCSVKPFKAMMMDFCCCFFSPKLLLFAFEIG